MHMQSLSENIPKAFYTTGLKLQPHDSTQRQTEESACFVQRRAQISKHRLIHSTNFGSPTRQLSERRISVGNSTTGTAMWQQQWHGRQDTRKEAAPMLSHLCVVPRCLVRQRTQHRGSNSTPFNVAQKKARTKFAL